MSTYFRNLFQVTKWSPAFSPTAGTYGAAALRGVALMQDGETAGVPKFALATNGWAGFLVRPVSAAPADAVGALINREAFMPSGPFGLAGSMLEDDYVVDGMVSVERADEWEAEQPEHVVTSGTGAITAAVSLQATVSFYQGKARLTQTGETSYAKVVAILTPVNTANTDAPGGAVAPRFRFERI